MWPVSSRWLPALGASQKIFSRVEVWRGNSKLGVLPISDGSISVTAKNRVRRSLNLTVSEAYFPSNPTDWLAPYGTELRVFRGIDYGDTVEEVPVFRGCTQTVTSPKRYGGDLTVTANDLMQRVNDARFEQPRAATSGSTTGGIGQLLTEALPSGTSVVVGLKVRDSTIPDGLLWDRDRGQAVDDLAVSIGADVWCDAYGVPRIMPPSLLTDSAVWRLADGIGGTVVSDARTVTRDGVYSVVVVVIERSDGSAPIQVVVADTDPLSPTYVGGIFGRVPRFYRSPLIVDTVQAVTAGNALLARSTGLARSRVVECVPNAALEAGDRIDIDVAGILEAHIADAFTLPLGPGSMQITTRSAKPDPGDT